MSRVRTAKPGTALARSPMAQALKVFGALLFLTLMARGAGILQPAASQTNRPPVAPATPTPTA
ncbi:MAG: hypothetical protein H7293_11435, partial [Candidatus Saccharibacteria bacterium]|nr:hypothetical protein [Rhodoferax sp.]